MSWHQFDNGNTIGQKGHIDGIIIFDEEHELGARVTIEKGGRIYPKLFSTKAQIYGGYFSMSCHYTSTEAHAKQDVAIIKTEFEKALAIIAKTPPKSKRNYENLSKIWLELYNLQLSETFSKLLQNPETYK